MNRRKVQSRKSGNRIWHIMWGKNPTKNNLKAEKKIFKSVFQTELNIFY